VPAAALPQTGCHAGGLKQGIIADVYCAPNWNFMEIKVNFFDKLRIEAKFDDFTVISDLPIRYKGDGPAPGPLDYFLASSALCAAYFVKL
jgi:hypothetical protein